MSALHSLGKVSQKVRERVLMWEMSEDCAGPQLPGGRTDEQGSWWVPLGFLQL